MEIVIALFVLVIGSLAFSAWRRRASSGDVPPGDGQESSDTGRSIRTCRACGYEGEMKTWISHYTLPKAIVVMGFLLGYIPGLIFLLVYLGKYKCPRCGAIGKNRPVEG